MPPSQQQSTLLGKVIDGKVRLLSLIGEGGMGAVYRGRQLTLDRDVAVKLLKPQYLASEDLVRRFYHEAKSAGQLRSRHVIGVLDYGRVPEGAYIIMELSQGVALAQILYEVGSIAIDRSVSIAAQILSGLAEAHAKGIIHRDLKTDNILIERDFADKDFALILDFGIAKLASSQSVQTAVGSIFGTPSYMSPEQCQGITADARTDLYSVGVMLYEMITGQTPFGDRTPTQLLIAHIKEPPAAITSKNPSVPPVLAQIVMSLLAKKRDERPQDADSARRALLSALATAPISPDWSSFESTIMDTNACPPSGEDDKTLPPSTSLRPITFDIPLADTDVSSDRVPELVGDVSVSVTMNKDEWRIIAQLGQRRSLREIAGALDLATDEVIKYVRPLVQRGLMRLEEKTGDPLARSDTRKETPAHIEDPLPSTAIALITSTLTETLGPIATLVVRGTIESLSPNTGEIRRDQLIVLIERVALKVKDAAKRRAFLQSVREALARGGFWRDEKGSR